MLLVPHPLYLASCLRRWTTDRKLSPPRTTCKIQPWNRMIVDKNLFRKWTPELQDTADASIGTAGQRTRLVGSATKLQAVIVSSGLILLAPFPHLYVFSALFT